MKIIILTFLFFLSFSSLALAVENKIDSIKVVTPEWEGFTNKDGSGLYFEVVRKAFSLSNIEVNYTFAPWPRAVKNVNENQKDAMLGAYNTVQESIYPKYPIDTEYTLIVYKKDSLKKWNGLKSLAGKTVHWVRGYDYHKSLASPVKWDEVLDTEQGLTLLKMGRIKFFIDSQNTLRPKLKEMKLDSKEYVTKTVLTKNLYVRFSRTEKSKELITIFDQNMKKLIQSNELRKIYSKWNHHFPNFAKLD